MDTGQTPGRLVIVLNGKGGVGKSFFATNFVQYLKDRKQPHRAIDTDNENSTLKRYHHEADFVDLNDPRGLDALFATVETSRLVVMDGRAASTDLILDYFAEVSAFELLYGLDVRLTLAIPINHEADSVTQAKLISDALGDRCDYLIVRNQAHSGHFTIYEKSRTRGRLTGELGAREMVMPRMYDWLVAALNQHNNGHRSAHPRGVQPRGPAAAEELAADLHRPAGHALRRAAGTNRDRYRP